jgi:hypothetical protein
MEMAIFMIFTTCTDTRASICESKKLELLMISFPFSATPLSHLDRIPPFQQGIIQEVWSTHLWRVLDRRPPLVALTSQFIAFSFPCFSFQTSFTISVPALNSWSYLMRNMCFFRSCAVSLTNCQCIRMKLMDSLR